MPEIRISFNPYPLQREIFTSPARYRVVRGGRRSGKSRLGLHDMLRFAVENPKSKLLYIAPTNRQAKQVGYYPMLDITPKALVQDSIREPGNFQIHLVNGSIIFFRSAESRDQVLRGEFIRYLLLDEIDYFPDGEYLWSSVLRPAMMDTQAPVLALSSPESEGGLISKFMEEWPQLPNGAAWQLTTRDNPYIDPAEIDEAAESMDDITYRREILGEAVGYSGLCFSLFNPEAHVLPRAEFPRPLAAYKFVAGLDYGVVDPTAIVYAYVDYQGRCWIFDEFYQPCETMEPIYRSLREHNSRLPPGQTYTLYYDTAHPGVANELRIRGLAVLEKSHKDVRPGIQRVNEWFSTGRLCVAAECENLIREIKSYRWDQTRTGERLDKPGHKNSHLPDATRYLIASMAVAATAHRPAPEVPFNSVAQLERELHGREKRDRLLRLSGLRA